MPWCKQPHFYLCVAVLENYIFILCVAVLGPLDLLAKYYA
jgi:hypothetical protein